MASRKVAVIGAGPFGLAVVRYLKAESGIGVVCYERRSVVGGMWNYEPSPRSQTYISPVYKNMRTNSMRQFYEFPDFPLDEKLPAWPTWKQVLQILTNYSNHFKLEENIQFNTDVVKVSRINKGGTAQFSVQTRPHDKSDASHVTENIYDDVIVATGYTAKPLYPEISGRELFHGDVLHSCEYREPETFTGKTVLLVGNGPSAWDMAFDLSPYVKQVLVSYHKTPFFITLPENGKELPGISSFTSTGVLLVTGESVPCDAVIFCTGYLPHFPFLDASCRTTVDDHYIQNLYKMVVHTQVPGLYFAGLIQFSPLCRSAAIHGMFIASILSGRADLPSAEDMEEDVQKEKAEHLATGASLKEFYYMCFKQEKYIQQLEEIGHLPPEKNIIHRLNAWLLKVIFVEKKYIEMRNMKVDVINDDEYSVSTHDKRCN